MKEISPDKKKNNIPKYDHLKIEKKWAKVFEASDYSQAQNESEKEKFYCLIEFPYPSGDGLHVGHVRSYTALDAIARMKRAQGYNVLYPIGWDAFGLPTENYAIKTGKDPKVITKENTDNYRKQLKSLGISFDWAREVNTTDPLYYKWTQWIFLQFLKEGLAYKARIPINWCPKDKIGLANEEVVDGKCERCGTPVEKKEKEQWMLAITKYAERLDKDLDSVDFEERIKQQQRNWIGKSEGAEISYQLVADSFKLEPITVFTTRPDTIFGATYVVIAPEHELAQLVASSSELQVENAKEIKEYIQKAKNKTEIERTAEGKEKTGVEIKGIKAINPATKEEIPVWIADYVIASYGTGAIMAVPADDKRDREFAEKFKLPITEEYSPARFEDFGKKITRYKLRDWIFSRQRYWGEPIPVIHCESCGIVPVPEKDLPVVLPEVEHYEPTDNGESPLAGIESWVNTSCPKCGESAKRETDTMPNWAGSSWYYLRYTDPENSKEFASKEALEQWVPVDWYNGGMEHTTLHLLYSRFWHKFLFDQKLVPTSEPYKKRTSHGLILASDGEKMSKSRGNVINPDDIVKRFGADTLRVYEMFMGPFDQAISWSEDGVVGPRRFIERIWRLAEKLSEDTSPDDALEEIAHKTIEKVTSDISKMGFNTAMSSLMVFANEIEKRDVVPQQTFKILLQLFAPFAPYVSEELWEIIGEEGSVHVAKWPVFDPSKTISKQAQVAVQINGKTRAQVSLATDLSEEEAVSIVKADKEVIKWLEGREIKRIVFVKNKIINFVVTID